MPNKINHLIFFAVVTLIGGTILCFCGNNLYHQRFASRILSFDECLYVGCHGNSKGKYITLCFGKECLLNNSHSILNQYPPPGKEKEFAPVSNVEWEGGIFENGKTTCLSCHNLTRPPPHLLKDGEEFCIICHINRVPIKDNLNSNSIQKKP